jgi:hypothetical protein
MTASMPSSKSFGAKFQDAKQKVRREPGLRRSQNERRTPDASKSEIPPRTPVPLTVKSWWRDPASIPRRHFLYGQHYIRRQVGVTIAAGGRGKTTLACYEAVSMTVGRDLQTGDPLPSGPLRVWLLNGEEDQDELDRRVAAVCQRYGICESDLGGRLFVQSVRDCPMRIAKPAAGGAAAVEQPVADKMKGFISRNRIDVFMVDPLVSFHSVPENDNGAMDVVVKQGFGAVAYETASAGELFHHPGKPKPGQAETTVEDGRGASAIIWAVRSARVLNFMTPAEAEKIGVSEDERRRHVRIANGKANMAPIGSAKWMKIEVENLPNGDAVACGTLWKPPNPFDGVTVEDMKVAQQVAQGGAYRTDSQSPDWLGWWMAENLPHLNIKTRHSDKPRNKAEVTRLNNVLKTWTKNGVLATEEREDDHRKLKTFFVAGKLVESPSTACSYEANDDE